MPSNLQISHLNPDQHQVLERCVYKYGEIPDWLNYYNPKVVEDIQLQNQIKTLPTEFNQLLSQEGEIFTDNADYLASFFSHFESINIYEIAEISPFVFLPFMVSLGEQEPKLSYTPVATIRSLGQSGTNSLKAVFDLFPNQIDLTFNKEQVVNIDIAQYYCTNEESVNIHLLLNSYLGNSIKPKQILRNLYNSMQSNDYLLLQQSIYQPGLEDLIEGEYRNWIIQDGVFECTKELSRQISNTGQINVCWSDGLIDFESNEQFSGVQATVKDLKIDTYNLATKNLSLFRSIRFPEDKLIKYLIESNFRLKSILYNQSQSSALFICQK
jgi:hypothetical protein